MPIYDYLCTECDHRADILHGINDPGPNFCPSCGREGTMRKQFTTPAIHFKGSGWAKKDRGSSSAGTKTSKPSTEPKDEARSEPKSEPKTESKSDSGTGGGSGSSSSGTASTSSSGSTD
jgi:putative FmdB family regulatory protein